MNKLVSHIINKEFDSANASLNEAMEHIIEGKLQEMRQQIDLTELSKDTLKSYITKADDDANKSELRGYALNKRPTRNAAKKAFKRSVSRTQNKEKAMLRLRGHFDNWSKPYKMSEETIEEGRHKGIGNKKKKGRLAAQTADLRNTFGVAPGKRRRQGPRTPKLEEGYFKNKDIDRQEQEEREGKPPFKPDAKDAPKHTAKNLARRGKKEAIRKVKEKLNEMHGKGFLNKGIFASKKREELGKRLDKKMDDEQVKSLGHKFGGEPFNKKDYDNDTEKLVKNKKYMRMSMIGSKVKYPEYFKK